MNKLACLALVLGACASAPRAKIPEPIVFQGVALSEVREAARAVVEDVAHRWSVVRVTGDGSVMTEGWIGDCDVHVTCRSHLAYPGAPGPTPWTTIQVHLHDVGPDAGVEVDVRYEDCDPRVDCVPQRLSSTGALEREIFDGIRARLEAGT